MSDEAKERDRRIREMRLPPVFNTFDATRNESAAEALDREVREAKYERTCRSPYMREED